MKAALAMMFPVSLLGMRGQCYSVVTLVIIVRPAGAWSELTRARQPAGPRLLGFLPPWSASLARRGWTRVWGENFIKLYHLSCPWPALPSCVFQSILWCYKLPQYICSPRVHCLLFMFKTLWLKRGFKSAALASLFPSVSSMIRNASHSLLDLVVCSTFLVTIP